MKYELPKIKVDGNSVVFTETGLVRENVNFKIGMSFGNYGIWFAILKTNAQECAEMSARYLNVVGWVNDRRVNK